MADDYLRGSGYQHGYPVRALRTAPTRSESPAAAGTEIAVGDLLDFERQRAYRRRDRRLLAT
jgi:hypothetical protein